MNITLPVWLQRALGIECQPGEGAVCRLEHHWGLPSWLTLVAAAAIVAWVVGVYLRERGPGVRRWRLPLAGLRLAAIGLTLLLIAQVGFSLRRTGLPYVAVLLDDSQSMTIADRGEPAERAAIDQRLRPLDLSEPSRWNLAQTVLCEDRAALLAGLASRYKLRFYYLTGPRASESVDPNDLAQEIRAQAPKGDRTRLGAGVLAVLDDLRGSPPAAIVAVTDGVNTEGPSLADAARQARRVGAPLFLVGLGDDKPACDLRLSDLLVDDTAFVDDLLQFQFQLTGMGLVGRKAEVVLRVEGQPEPLARVTATLGPDGQGQTLRLTHRPSAEGRFRYTLEAAALDGERSVENNRLAREIQVRKQKVRVLLAQAEPSYEFRYLRNMLARDDTIELHTVLQEADPEYVQQDPTALPMFPLRREELFAYDVIVLGDLNPASLSQTALQSLADFVTQPGKGGAMAIIAGPKYMPSAYRDTPLAAILPIDPRAARMPSEAELSKGFQVQPTTLGLSMPNMQLGDTPEETAGIWRSLPPVYWSLEDWALKPGARVAAEDPRRTGPDGRPLPLIVMQYVGAGRVLWHAFDESWRWRWRLGDVFFARYWVQTMRYLARSTLSGGQAVELSTERREYALGETIRLRARFHDERLAPPEDDGVTVALQGEGQPTQRLRLRRTTPARGLFEGTLTAGEPGARRVWLAIPSLPGRAPATDFTVVAPPGEFQTTPMQADAMQNAARHTKGRFYTFATANRLLRDLPPGQPVPIETLPTRPLWNRWPALALLFGLLIAEWILRKKGGLA